MQRVGRQRFPYTTEALWTRPETEADWHALRQTDVTATDSAALFGVSPYSTPFELFHRKAGSLKVEIEETERLLWGKRLQSAIALGICEDNGWRIVGDHPFLYARSGRFVGMGASPDYIVFCPLKGVGLLEIKNVDSFIARNDWSDEEAPVHIEFQLQHQLECTGLSWGAIGGLIGGNKARVIIRERDREVGTEIGNRVTDLWRRVRDKDPPAPNYLADYDAIRQLYKNADVGKVLDFTGVPLAAESDAEPAEVLDERGQVVTRLHTLCAAERDAKLRKDAAEEDGKRAKAEILTIIEDAEAVTGIPGFKIKATTQHREERTQVVKASSFRDLRISVERPPKSKASKGAAEPEADQAAA